MQGPIKQFRTKLALALSPLVFALFLACLLTVTPLSSAVPPAYASTHTGTETALTRVYLGSGKVIVVSLSHQWLYAYQNGVAVFNTAVMTGRSELPTPLGTYHVFAKLSPTTFYSRWPPGSPFYYPPTHINYALAWRAGGFFLHDSYWHTVYGPGTNHWHFDPVYGWQDGTHGCVAMPLAAAAWLYHWAPIGTTVRIVP